MMERRRKKMFQFSMEFHRDFPWKIYEREHKHQFLHLRASCLEMGKVTISQINTNLYLVQNSEGYHQLQLRDHTEAILVYRQTT